MEKCSLAIIKTIRRRLQTLGLSSQESRLISTRLKDLIRSNGLKWTIQYLKDAGDVIWHYLYGSPARGSWKRWISTYQGFPRIFLEARRMPEESLARLAKIARAFRYDQVQPEQVAKVRDAVTSPYSGEVNALDEVHQLTLEGLSYFGIPVTPCLVGPPKPVTKQFRKVMSVSGPTKTVQRPPLVDSIRILKSVPLLRMIPDYDCVLEPLDMKSISALIHDESIEELPTPCVGEIHSAQEGGGKLRMFASPYTVVQCLLSPIHDWIDNYRRQCPSDCTYDQASGAQFAQQMLVQGKTVYSVDLSTATCRFPLDPQMRLLKHLGLPHEYLRALNWACTGPWKVGSALVTPFGVETLQWAVGQPLGIRPSMSMFSLTHNLLLAGLSKRLDIPLSFRVLGDDVLITDKALYESYISIVERLGIPISWNKSHCSAQVGEFAGFTISKTTLTRPGQWRMLDQSNIFSYAEEFGVMVHETSEAFADVQRLYLFSKGLWNPPIEEWSLWLKRNSSGLTPDKMYWAHPKPDWYQRICKEFELQFNRRLTFLPEGQLDKVAKIFEGLPEFDFRDTFEETARLPWVTNTVISAANQALLFLFHSYHLGLISMADSSKHCKKVLEVAHKFLYSPPPSRSERVSFRKYLELCSTTL